MRFLTRSIAGGLWLAVAAGLLLWGGWRFADARREAPSRPAEAAAERVFAVDMREIETGVARPVIDAYGEIASWRTLELRASAAGRIVEIAPEFRDGAAVSAGAVLLRIDPSEYEAAVGDAEAALREAEADLAEARQAVVISRIEAEAAETQRALREAGAQRRRDLAGRGVSTSAEVEESEMMLAAAEQALASRRQAVISAEIRIDRAALNRDRAEIALAEARRALADTVIRAPFDGLVAEVSVVRGGLVARNERLSALIDPGALEAAFRVTTEQFARLLDAKGRLVERPVLVSLSAGSAPLSAPGVIERAGAMVGAGETGRLVYARLDPEAAAIFRPGDFVSVTVEEPPLAEVAIIPAAAADERGELLLVDAESRLRPLLTTILRRQGDLLIVSGAPDGARYVAARAPQLGPGVLVRPLERAPEPLVELDPERRLRLIRFVEADEMPAPARARLLDALRSGRAPAGIVDELETRMGRAG
ncbi:MAG: efflux RND transporter periplasmic adaptor subunit [Pikeienuella sp.]|uniref:efflux RND transporter periplasmic adaptor subunit n=1 Tax=Pikeienuella sp. TaxID=2831957 RepID=UPI003918DA6E